MIRAIALACLITTAAVAETPRVEMVHGDRFVIIDGDTVALPCRQPDCTGPERIRILNIDAPETRGAACEAEMVKGLDAKAALAGLLRGRSITLRRCEPDTGRCADRYGRTLATLASPAGDIGDAMIAAGHALPWSPGPEAKAIRQQIWCRGK